MKIKILIVISAILLFTLSGSLSAKVIALKWANYFGPTSAHSLLFEKMITEIEQRTKGKVQIKHYPAGQLLPATRMYDGVVQGIADIGFSTIAYNFGVFPFTEILALPIGFPTAWVNNHVFQDFYEHFRPKEWERVKVLNLNACPPYVLSATKPVRKLEELQGLKIRAVGYGARVIEAWGGTSVTLPIGETYDAIVKGMVNGVYIPIETLKTWKLGEVLKYSTRCWQAGEAQVFYLIMNKNIWNKLPEEVREVFENYPFVEKFAEMWNNVDVETLLFAKEKLGVKFIDLDEQEAKRWKEAVYVVVEAHKKILGQKGYSAEDINAAIDYVQKRIQYWLGEQMKRGIKSSTGPRMLDILTQ